MAKYQVWKEGFSCTGNDATAQMCGVFEGESFEEAVLAYYNSLDREAQSYWTLQDLTCYGCRFFDNEADARKSFG